MAYIVAAELPNGEKISFNVAAFRNWLNTEAGIVRQQFDHKVHDWSCDMSDRLSDDAAEYDDDELDEINAKQNIVAFAFDDVAAPIGQKEVTLLHYLFEDLIDQHLCSKTMVRFATDDLGLTKPAQPRPRASAPAVASHTPYHYPFKACDSGRWKSKRSKQKNDCTVRAVVAATGLEYDEVYDVLAKHGRKCGKGAPLRDILAKNPFPGFRFKWVSFPAERGKERVHVDTFLKTKHTKGKVICKISKHVYAVVDGVVIDTYPSRPDRCVYGCWVVEPR